MGLFAQLEQKNRLPSGLLDAVWSAESSRGQNMQSPKGAQGHFQFMPATAQQYGLNDPNNLQQSAAAAAKMLSDMMQQTGSVPGALAAYNWGIGNVQRKGMDAAPAETRNYIQKVTANMSQQSDPFAELNKEFSQAAPSQQQDDPFAELNKEFSAPAPQQAAPAMSAQQPNQPVQTAPAQQAMLPEQSGGVQPAPHQAGRFGGTLPQLPANAGKELMADTGNLLAGSARGAGSIGATILAPWDIGKDALNGKGLSLESNNQRRTDLDSMLRAIGANPDSMAFKAGKIGTEILGTGGMGGALAKGAALLPGAAKIAPLIESIGSGGFRVGGLTGLPALATRSAGGAITGGASAGLINPQDAGMGAMVGGVIPGAASVAGSTTRAIGRAVRGGDVKPAVVDLANKAKDIYGIDIPADRIVKSKPMNALAASLEYMPFSGRTGTLSKMNDQLKTALSRTIGQDTDDVGMALRNARADLGAKFETVLQNNKVKVDKQFVDELAQHAHQASNDLESGQAAIIQKQIDEIMAKVQNGEIDGQAAYNIKRTLDRIGGHNTPQAYYAGDLKKSLMSALNRSMKPEEAADFAKVRRQYGTMLDLEKLAQNGAEGDISVARLANMKNIGNPELQDLADISAQFLKSRESPHGAMQRLMLGGLGAIGAGSGAVAPLVVAGGIAAGRGANMALNSKAVRGLLTRPPSQGRGLLSLGAEKANKVLPLLAPQLLSDQ
ncbi:putative soluble lytic transglycosylase fused to an ABC-type amino acid-binding protein [Pseudomonas sp. GM21]|uniref:transglycosylase SLT domain-containing protein n=1 Tax=Pseudomonas sp. GM21 TaxID=1144325 RepID=UPI000272289E|nr:transglycosylase SLT domain-containing protein [Pseudomonas sp. GM21]EJM25134.1 putative soluble lytic transglycosylase fused to an ABC-type amino acid-binding protein [Pseudomonas sp. GM21]